MATCLRHAPFQTEQNLALVLNCAASVDGCGELCVVWRLGEGLRVRCYSCQKPRSGKSGQRTAHVAASVRMSTFVLNWVSQ